MTYLDTPHKRKSAIITAIIMALLMLVIFFTGMTYLDPPEENGIAVNFGTTDYGSGNIQPTEPIKSSPVEEPIEETEVEEEVVEETPVEESAPAPDSKAEDVVTSDNEESIKIKKAEAAKRKAETDAKRKAEAEQRRKEAEAERKERARKAAEARKRAEQEAKRKKLDAMMGGLNSSNGKASGGEGDDGRAGDKGNPNGNPNAKGYYGNSYYGSGGSGKGGYGLKGRNLVKRGTAYKQDCNEYGRVVVKIEVDKSGKVIKAVPGVKGSTNTAPCLLAPAKRSALSYKWNFDSKAPSKQIGFIIVNFN